VKMRLSTMFQLAFPGMRPCLYHTFQVSTTGTEADANSLLNTLASISEKACQHTEGLPQVWLGIFSASGPGK
jgi:hypothetical protein